MARPKTGRKPLTTAHVGLMTEEQRMKLRVIPTARRVEVWMKEADRILNPPEVPPVRSLADQGRDDEIGYQFYENTGDWVEVSQMLGDHVPVIYIGSVEDVTGVELDQDMVKRLIPLLERFVATGTIEEVAK